MRKLALLAAVAAVSAAPAAAGTGWSARLDAMQERPHPVGAAAATGSFTAKVSGTKLTWKLSFARLTGPAAAAHIHLGRAGAAGKVVVPLCGPCKRGASGTATLTRALKAAFKKHLLYVNVHTAKNPAGEIRGQLR